MFRLLAIRPLVGCDAHICKCLKIGMMYYFCSGYQIMKSSSKIIRLSRNLKPLKNDFFANDPEVNISAIVGKNGDGKSTIVEIIMRMVNNCAMTYELAASSKHIRKARGTVAELYYLIDNKVYLMKFISDNETRIWEIADLSDQSKDEWEIKIGEPLSRQELPNCFFFTIVSNYSHYAYNIYDYDLEWEVKGEEQDDNEKCWLHYIFHKNDGYLTPITLHPYRDRGNINVNREKTLSKQRLLSLFLNADHPSRNSQSFRRVNGKDAKLLVLTELNYSKLQQNTIIDTMKAFRQKIKLTAVLNQIKAVGRGEELNTLEYERLVDSVLPYLWEEQLDEVLLQDNDFKPFVEDVIHWLDRNTKNVLAGSGDIRQVLKGLNELHSKYHDDNLNFNVQHGFYGSKYGCLAQLSSAQLGRLDTIYRIMKRIGVHPSILTKSFADLSLKERLDHYKVYKIWAIIETYPQFEKMLAGGNGKNSVREFDNQLEQCVDKILLDDETHVSRKIRQVENFENEGLEDGGLYERLGDWNEGNKNLLVSLDSLKEHYHGEEITPDQLPPAIYEWDIVFGKEGEDDTYIPFDLFSSGEKQMLNSLGAIIYHLQNLETSSTIRYPNVNLVLEEIELYYHPEYQREFIYRLVELIKGMHLQTIKSVNILFVTHSPFILSDIPKCNVMFLQDGMVKNDMQENTFGSNIHSLLKNGFFLPNLPMGEFAYQKINHLFYLLNSGDFNPKTDLDDIYQQILLVGEPFLRSQLLSLYHAHKGQ